MRQNDYLRLLIISESRNEAEVLINYLRNAGHMIRSLQIDNEGHLSLAIRDQEWDLLLYLSDALDLELITVCALLRDGNKDIPVIMVTDDISPQQRLKILTIGASDSVPNVPAELFQQVVNRELTQLRLRREMQHCQNTHREIERRYHIMLNSARDAIAYIQEGAHVLVNPAYLQLFHFNHVDEVIGLPMLDMVPPSAHQALKSLLRATDQPNSTLQVIESQALRSDGEQLHVRFEATATMLDGESCMQIVVHDLAPTSEFQEQINDLVRRDSLTGLYNRQYFLQELERLFSQHPGIIYLTFDNLIMLRGKIGINGVDRILKEIALLIARQVESNDLVAHFSDGVFTILAPRGDESRLRILAQGMQRALNNELMEIEGITVNIVSSIALHPNHLAVNDTRTLFSRLEAAALAARETKENRIVVCLANENAQLPTSINSVDFLRTALENNQLFLLYQPVVYLQGDGREGYEIFPRLTGANGGYPIAAQIMRTVDDNHLPTMVDRWVIARVLEVLANRQHHHPKSLFFYELSRDTLLDKTFPLWLGEKIKSWGVPPASLILQVENTLVIDHYIRVRDFVPSLHAQGCGFALAHYHGSTGVAAQLSQLEINYFKIADELIMDLATNREHQTLVRAINEQVHTLGKQTIAEAVVDANTLSLLWQYGIDYIQGDYLQKPAETMNYDFSNLFLE